MHRTNVVSNITDGDGRHGCFLFTVTDALIAYVTSALAEAPVWSIERGRPRLNSGRFTPGNLPYKPKMSGAFERTDDDGRTTELIVPLTAKQIKAQLRELVTAHPVAAQFHR